MSNPKKITSLAELELEIYRLKVVYKEQEKDLAISGRKLIDNFTISNIIKKLVTPKGLLKVDEQLNISGKIMSIVVPLLLNSTLFRGSGLVTKTLGALVSGSIGKSIDAENITGLVNTIKNFFKKDGKKKKGDGIEFKDYGIPPDSETF